jgi:3-hydroxyisobutyrate dehydrogenase-like beta-hydroxyacid dehydrogenase
LISLLLHSQAGLDLIVYDVDQEQMNLVSKMGATAAKSSAEVAQKAKTVISILPNDTVLNAVTHGPDGLIANMQKDGIHISCSTVSPHTSRSLAVAHSLAGSQYVGAPVFARPDGLANKSGTWVVSGPEAGRKEAARILKHTCSAVYEFGDDVGSANVVKLGGNFMIAAAIESIGEALALCENNGVDREVAMKMYSDTIFNCLIYKGYGNRVAGRKHYQDGDHPGFALELGLKDVNLVLDTAKRSSKSVPMPFASLLSDRYHAARNKGRGMQDWSAIGLSISEDAGVDVSHIAKNPKPE